jgi:hypothetical protein
MRHAWTPVLTGVMILATAGVVHAGSVPQARYVPPAVSLGAPVAAPAVPFAGGRYSFGQPPTFHSGYNAPGYVAPQFYNPRYPNPGPYFFTPGGAWSPSYYSYYYTPGYFRY